MKRPILAHWILVIVAVVGVVGIRLVSAAPTLTTITINGNMADWAAVLANPDNIVYDGPGGGLADADAPIPAKLDVDTIAFTWDATYLYFYVHRQNSSGEFNYFFFHFDLDNDGFVPNNAALFRVGWWGSNGKTNTYKDTYKAASIATGDPITNAMGKHDGYRLPGTLMPGGALENLNGGSTTGREMETRVAWAALGVAPGTPLQFHLSTTRKLTDYPAAIADNAGRSIAYPGVDLSPDRAIGWPPGGPVALAHVVANIGGVPDTFDMTWTSTGAFAPILVTFYRDTDNSGTLTPGDTPLTDTDADTLVDTGSMTQGNSRAILALAVIPPTATLGQVCTLTLRARSSVNLSVTDTATDTITIVQPSLTLVKAVDRATGPPGTILTYTVTYSNTGTGDAISVDIQDPIPVYATYVPGSATGAGMAITWSHDGGLTWNGLETPPVTHVRWQRATALQPGTSGDVTFGVTIN